MGDGWSRRATGFFDFPAGGWDHVYSIRRNGVSVGELHISRRTRNDPVVEQWSHGGRVYADWPSFRQAVIQASTT